MHDISKFAFKYILIKNLLLVKKQTNFIMQILYIFQLTNILLYYVIANFNYYKREIRVSKYAYILIVY